MSSAKKPSRLSLLDASFLHIETRETPMHVASLQIFQRPAGADREMVHQIADSFRARPPVSKPWNLKLDRVLFSSLAPAMKVEDKIDMDYHVRHIALPEPGGERELGEVISHLHGELLDRSRPLWTCHIIDGLENDRFAIYIKIHHALTDGVRGIQMTARCLAADPKGAWSAPWHWEKPARKNQGAANKAAAGEKPPSLGLSGTSALLKHLLKPRDKNAPETVIKAFESPRSALNGPVTAARRVATQSLDVERIKAIGKRSGTSLNDVFLAICSSALRRHLLELEALPEAALVAGVPVSLRAPGDSESGNAIGFLWASLASDLADPLARLQKIHSSMQASKEHLYALPAAARPAYTTARMAPAIGVLVSGLGAKLRPPMNVTISNVPGPAESLYLNGARLEALYPVSLPLQGLGLNITCISYAGQLNVGFTGSRDGVPHLQRVAVYSSEALDELEQACEALAA